MALVYPGIFYHPYQLKHFPRGICFAKSVKEQTFDDKYYPGVFYKASSIKEYFV
jgi:hypothetical protein